MSAPGIVYEGLIEGQPSSLSSKHATSSSSELADDAPDTSISRTLGTKTGSHALATANIDVKGTVQAASDTSSSDENEVANLGWHRVDEAKGDPFLGGWTNEEIWLFMRRFNKQIYRVKYLPEPPPGDLDLNCSDEEFSPDKLRSNLERFYMTVLVSLIAFGKHIARIRSWRETRRTAWFCTVYFAAWILDLLIPALLATLMSLIVFPRFRRIMFPPAPIALVGSNGGVQKPAAGVLGSHDSVTGAPENFKGEAVEQEASNFVNSLASVALSSAAGKNPQSEPTSGEEGSLIHDAVPDPTALATGAATARGKVSGGTKEEAHDKTKVPMEAAMWAKMRPAMHGINTATDDWERFSNALSPKMPFPKKHRYRLAGVVAPLFLISLFLSSYLFMKVVTFAVGFSFFGDPIIQRVLAWLNRGTPQWYKWLELRNNILRGVPTNAQITITLLRIGEARKAPIPPPPMYNAAPPHTAAKLTTDDLHATGNDSVLNASDEEINAAAEGTLDDGSSTTATDEAVEASRKSKHGHKGSKILGFFRGTTRATVGTAVNVDVVKAKIGSEKSKHRLGAIEDRKKLEARARRSGPIEFAGRYHGKKGKAHIISATAAGVNNPSSEAGSRPGLGLSPGPAGLDSPVLAFATEGVTTLAEARWQVPVADIAQLNKVGGFGWKAKLVIGWAMNREIQDGLEIIDRHGAAYTVTSMPLRDELFNRLVAMGDQKWEAL